MTMLTNLMVTLISMRTGTAAVKPHGMMTMLALASIGISSTLTSTRPSNGSTGISGTLVLRPSHRGGHLTLLDPTMLEQLLPLYLSPLPLYLSPMSKDP